MVTIIRPWKIYISSIQRIVDEFLFNLKDDNINPKPKDPATIPSITNLGGNGDTAGITKLVIIGKAMDIIK